jgi:hypothetical protein
VAHPCDESALRLLIGLFSHRPDDDVKAEVLECLGVLVSEPHFIEVMTALGVVPPLIELVVCGCRKPRRGRWRCPVAC